MPYCVNKESKIIEQEQIDKCDKQWLIIKADINWEDENMYCDRCYKQIESAYGGRR